MHEIFASAGKENIKVLNRFSNPLNRLTKRTIRSTRKTRNSEATGPTLKNPPTQLNTTNTKSKQFQRVKKYCLPNPVNFKKNSTVKM